MWKSFDNTQANQKNIGQAESPLFVWKRQKDAPMKTTCTYYNSITWTHFRRVSSILLSLSIFLICSTPTYLLSSVVQSKIRWYYSFRNRKFKLKLCTEASRVWKSAYQKLCNFTYVLVYERFVFSLHSKARATLYCLISLFNTMQARRLNDEN